MYLKPFDSKKKRSIISIFSSKSSILKVYQDAEKVR